MPDIPKSICILPWVHSQIGIDGKIYSCCEVSSSASITCKNDESLTAAWNNPKYKEIRKIFLDGKTPAQCSMCVKKESLGHESDRQKANQWYADYFHHLEETASDGSLPTECLKSIDLRLSNICNYKCRTCEPGSSSALAKDWVFLTKEKIEQPLIKAFTTPAHFLNYLEDIPQQLDKVFFVGGEPFLMVEQFQLIKQLNQSGQSQSLELYYNTNLSVTKYGKQEIVDLLQGFKRVIFNISIDETDKREGFEWKKFKENFWHFKNNMNNLKINLNITVSNINAFYLPQLIQSCRDELEVEAEAFILNPVLGPQHYTLWNLPPKLKALTLEKLTTYQAQCDSETLRFRLDGIINFINEEAKENEIKAFKQITKRLYQIKGESFQKLFPELAPLLD
jgi:MoaA/NifB/PqqE/SkfB family radical SAM enzyme